MHRPAVVALLCFCRENQVAILSTGVCCFITQCVTLACYVITQCVTRCVIYHPVCYTVDAHCCDGGGGCGVYLRAEGSNEWRRVYAASAADDDNGIAFFLF